ncbi:MAG TPA: hypothetical protein VM686_01325, partial [Polyangiaceae bacterium]|nr:hypothetical protein [Polyangiaceae bacterium]
DCFDGDACTVDTCDGNTCSNEAAEGCCLSDADCDDPTPVCHLASARCVEEGAEEPPPTSGEGGSGAGPTTTPNPSSGSGGVVVNNPPTAPAEAKSEDDGGCSCRVASPRAPVGTLSLVLAASLLAFARRSGRRKSSLTP